MNVFWRLSCIAESTISVKCDGVANLIAAIAVESILNNGDTGMRCS